MAERLATHYSENRLEAHTMWFIDSAAEAQRKRVGASLPLQASLAGWGYSYNSDLLRGRKRSSHCTRIWRVVSCWFELHPSEIKHEIELSHKKDGQDLAEFDLDFLIEARIAFLRQAEFERMAKRRMPKFVSDRISIDLVTSLESMSAMLEEIRLLQKAAWKALRGRRVTEAERDFRLLYQLIETMPAKLQSYWDDDRERVDKIFSLLRQM